MTDITVRVKDLTIGYDKKMICENMNFAVKVGEITCFMGKNGAGKSTLLKTIAGLLPSVKGEVLLLEKEQKSYKRNELSKLLAVVLTQRISVDFMTAMEIVCMGRYPHTGFMGRLSDSDRKISLTSMEQTGAIELKDRVYSTLSDGEKQKVLIARAIAQEPKILLLDEPTTHLDIKHKLEIMDLLNGLARDRKMSVILSLHELDLAVKACQHIIAMKDQRIMYDGAPEAMEKDDLINRLFDMSPNRFSHVTGSVELSAGQSDQYFIVACCGSGIPVYRLFAKNRKGFSTGILYESDSDYSVALSMGADVIANKPYETKQEKEQEAVNCVEKARIIVDTGFPINDQTIQNKLLINQAIEKNKAIFSFRNKGEFEKEFGKAQVTYINDPSDMESIFR